VLAGPGSGKTRLLTQEIQRRLTQGLTPEQIAGITFTRQAAHELKSRLRPPDGCSLPWVGTFHQLARRLQADLRRLPPQIDLDRLIPDATRLLESGSKPAWVDALRLIAVDEAQDLDRTQVDFLRALRRDTQATLLLVGDPDQAIFGFRQASARFLLDAGLYFSRPVKTVTLHENHRSAQAIVTTAQAILAHTAHPDSPCRHLTAARTEAHPAVRTLVAASAQEEARRIFEEVRTLTAVGVPLTEQAILVRTRAQLQPLRAEAAAWRIPTYTPPLDERLPADRETAEPPADRGITLLTMHQAKGREWTVVFIAGCQAGLVPHRAATGAEEQEEERRLLYVAVTRAKQLLWFCRHGEPSPFLLSRALSVPRPGPRAEPRPEPHAGGDGVFARLLDWFRR
jgi:superfamily I DNA/RNA helicase